MKKCLCLILALVLSMTLILTGCSGLTAKSVEKDPNKQVVESLASTMEAVFGNEQSPMDVLEAAMQKGVITIEMADPATGEEVKNTLAINSDKKSFSNKLQLNDGDQKLNLTVYGKDKELAFEMPEMLGEGVYGVNIGTLKEDLKDSILLEMEGMTYEEFMSEFETDFNEFMDLFESLNKEDSDKAFGELKEKLEKAIKDMNVSAKDEEVTVNGEKIKAVNVYYEFSADDLHDLLETVIDWEEDQAGILADLLGGTDNGMYDENFESYDSYFDAMRAELDTFFDETDGNCVLTFALNPKTKHIMLINLSFDGELAGKKDTSLNMSVNLGVDPTKTNEFTALCAIEAEDEDDAIELKLSWGRAHSNEKNVGEVKFSTSVGSEKSEIVIAYDWDKSDGDFELSMEADESNLKVTGKYKQDKNGFDFEIENLEADGEKQEITLKLSVAATDGKEVEAMPEYTNLLKISEEKLQEIAEAIENSGFADTYPDNDWEDDWDGDWDDEVEDNKENSNTNVSYGEPLGTLLDDGEILIYNKNGISIIADGFVMIGDEGLKISVRMENKGKKNVAWYTDYVSLDGFTLPADSYVSAEAGKTEEGYILLPEYYLTLMEAESFCRLSIPESNLYDTDSYDTIEQFGFSFNIEPGTSPEPVLNSGDIYTSDKFVVEALEVIYDEDYYNVVLLADNNFGEMVYLEVDDFKLDNHETNSFSYPPIFKDDVAVIVLETWAEDENIDYSKVKSVSFTMSVVSANTYETLLDLGEVKIDIG